MRQAFAGMVWSQQFYHYDVERWLEGDRPVSPPAARLSGRNAGWRHLDNRDILAMPDKWEYPWYAAWDVAFHCVVLAHLDPAAAKHQLLLLCREWYMHPNGQIPAYEWCFGDVNPPVHAWAALTVFRIDGGTDFDFLARVFQKLMLNFTWWVNRKDARGDNVFEGGFLGLDNIGPFDRSAGLPGGVLLEQSDGTAWMAKFCLNMLEMALRLANHDRTYEDVALKFFEHFASIAHAMSELWDEEDGFFYDRLRFSDGSTVPLRARSMVGLLPIFAAVELSASLWERLPDFRRRASWFITHKPELSVFLRHFAKDDRPGLLSLVDEPRLRRCAGAHARRRGVPLALRVALAVALPPRAPARRPAPGRRGAHRIRAGRVEERGLRRQLELAGPGLVPAELPGGGVAPAPARRARGGVQGGAAHRIGRPGEPRAGGRRARTPAASAVPPRRAWPPPGSRGDGALPERPGVARPHLVLRVLPWRDGRGAWRVAPDGVDGARGSADRRAPRSRG